MDRAQSDLVSVLMPAFNCESTLCAALESVLRQTYRHFEFIVVDDGSSDGTGEILAEYSRRDERITVIRTDNNHGITAALNGGLSIARGEFVARMDADDVCEPGRFEKQVRHLQQHSTCVAVGCNVVEIDATGAELRKRKAISRGVQMRDRCMGFRHFPPSPPTIAHSSAMIRAPALRAVGGYRPVFRSSQDRDLWWRLSRVGEIHRLPDRLLRYRVHGNSVSELFSERKAADALVADLSAVARHFDADDSRILEEYEKSRHVPSVIEQYAALIGTRYPVRCLAAFRAITRGNPSLVGCPGRSAVMAYALRLLYQFPFQGAGLRLLSAALRTRPELN